MDTTLTKRKKTCQKRNVAFHGKKLRKQKEKQTKQKKASMVSCLERKKLQKISTSSRRSTTL